MNLQAFKNSLQSDQPDDQFSVQLKALWYDGKGDWNKAHAEVDHLNDAASSLVHAYLHRKEGDIWNADYWYRRANESRPDVSLEKEWENLASKFLPEE